MIIFGIGTDIVNIKRMDLSLKKRGSTFKNRVFSKKEITYCENKKNSSAFYAKRFAAKEAFSKALGTGIRKGVNLKNIEVSNNVLGKPSISLKGKLSSSSFILPSISSKSFKTFFKTDLLEFITLVPLRLTASQITCAVGS